ncbi:unnamed protein product, partial [Polarella glacialis]
VLVGERSRLASGCCPSLRTVSSGSGRPRSAGPSWWPPSGCCQLPASRQYPWRDPRPRTCG